MFRILYSISWEVIITFNSHVGSPNMIPSLSRRSTVSCMCALIEPAHYGHEPTCTNIHLHAFMILSESSLYSQCGYTFCLFFTVIDETLKLHIAFCLVIICYLFSIVLGYFISTVIRILHSISWEVIITFSSHVGSPNMIPRLSRRSTVSCMYVLIEPAHYGHEPACIYEPFWIITIQSMLKLHIAFCLLITIQWGTSLVSDDWLFNICFWGN